MRTKNVIVLGILALILIAILVYTGVIMQPSENNTTTENTIVNITLNDTNNTTENNTTTTTTTQKKTIKSNTQSSSKSNSPSIVKDEVLYNYQVDDGSYYREVEYSDGSFKQYDLRGNEISPGDMT